MIIVYLKSENKALNRQFENRLKNARFNIAIRYVQRNTSLHITFYLRIDY